MTPDQVLAEAGIELARKVIAMAASDGRLADLARSQAVGYAREIIAFDHERREATAHILPFTGKTRPNPDQPGAA